MWFTRALYAYYCRVVVYRACMLHRERTVFIVIIIIIIYFLITPSGRFV